MSSLQLEESKEFYRQKFMKFNITVGVLGHLEQRLEDVAEEFLEVVHDFVWFEDITRMEEKYHLELWNSSFNAIIDKMIKKF